VQTLADLCSPQYKLFLNSKCGSEVATKILQSWDVEKMLECPKNGLTKKNQ